MKVKRCSLCVLPESFPGVSLGENEICQFCLSHKDESIDFEKVKIEVEDTISSSISSTNKYDVVLAFSGGKDSSYTLKYLKERFQAKILALTVDNGFISERARKNCSLVPANLGVDHIFFTPNPEAMINIYNKSLSENLHSVSALKRASSICNSCIQVINTQVINIATAFKVPIVAGGYIGGQIPSKTGFMKQSLAVTEVARKGFMSKLKGHFDDEALDLFRLAVNGVEDLLVVNPMVYLNKSEKEIISDIEKIGWIQPTDTGKSSTNCLLNDFAIHEHFQKHGFHPYVFETAYMVRNGTLSRSEALKKIELPKIDFTETNKKLKKYT